MKKICKCCLKELDDFDFYKNASKSDGLSTYCKLCTKIKLREWYLRPDVQKREQKQSLEYKKTEKGKACIKARVEREKNRKYALKNRILVFHLKSKWFGKIKSGEKRIEYRQVTPYWTVRLNSAIQKVAPDFSGNLCTIGNVIIFTGLKIPCRFDKGYTKERLDATIFRIETVYGTDTDLKIDDLVFAIHFELTEKK